MNEKAKILGVVLAAAMALGALTASAASAVDHHFTGTSGDSITAVALSPYVYEHTTASGKNNGCKEMTLSGEAGGATQTSLTLTPSFNECVIEEEGKEMGSMIFLLNGCHFQFTGVTTAGNPTGGEHASLHLECPPEKSIETRIGAFKLKCSRIATQEFQHAVRYENVETPGGKTHIRAAITGHGGQSITEGVCGEGTHDNSSIATELTLTTPNGISVSTT